MSHKNRADIVRGDIVILLIHPDFRSAFKQKRPALAIRRNADRTMTFALMSSKIEGTYIHHTVLKSEETGLNGDSRVFGVMYVAPDNAAEAVLKRLPEERVKEIVGRF